MNLGGLKSLFLVAVALALAGCSTRTTYYLKIQLSGEEVPCQGIDVDFSSYNYQAVLDSLAKVNNPGPRPDSTELLACLNVYQRELALRTKYSDQVNALRDMLETLDVKSIDYRKNYPRFKAMETKEKELSDSLHGIHQKYLEARSAYDAKLQMWGKEAYKGFADFKTSLPKELQTKTETTDAGCMIRKLVLPYAEWWLYAEVRKPGSTNEKLVWNFKMPDSDADSLMIILDESNAKTVVSFL